MYEYGRGVPQDDGEAVKWFRLATEQGNASAQYRLGVMYRIGEGVPQDDGEAVKWYRLAAEQGNVWARIALAHICLDRERELGVRVEACHISAEQGNAEAQFRLGVMYNVGEGVPQDDAEAFKWYRLAAEKGNVWARVTLARICLDPEREPVVRAEACRTAAEQGGAGAQSSLGYMYSTGEGVPQDDGEAVKWFRLAADQGNASAQSSLGYMYSTGEGVPQDDGEAVKWFRLAADQGNAWAQFSLGLTYYDGEGVPQDYGEAVKWYRLAADQGNASAQLNLGYMYSTGEGVPQDDGEAVKWYRLAADQGDASAQNNLGLMYAKGKGVPQNYIQAHMWLNLAGARGNEDARKTRDIVKDKMTPEQVAEAQRLASVWKPGMVIDAPAQMSELPSDGDALQQWDDDGNGRITCAEARRHGLAPVHRGHPAYSYMRDPDNDGIVCK